MQIQAVVKRREPGTACRRGQAPLHSLLKLVVEADVFDRTARDADKVVVMFEQWLREFEVSMVATGADALDHAGSLEHIEVAIHRAGSEVGRGKHDVGQGDGLSRR